MAAIVRVFVSSTMEDLASEREAVVAEIRRLTLEPVNAEDVLPTGATSWDVLAEEIRSSHVCIFLQGDRYGWIPTEGYGAGQDKSVSHLEVDLAQQCGIPILPFLKRLKYGADSASDDAIRRDKFRKNMGAWADGRFRTEFDGTIDLREKVFKALVGLFTVSYLRERVQAQGPKFAPGPPPGVAFATSPTPVQAPGGSARGEVLFAGAGLSLSAGYPSANALAGVLGLELGLATDRQHGYPLAQLFEFAEQTRGRARCLEIVRELLNPPLPVEPTPAHMAAVQRFSIILTTNYDTLFEQACRLLKVDFTVRSPRDQAAEGNASSTLKIYKIDGSIERPETLVLTLADVARARDDADFWATIEAVLQTSSPVVIGHSMRDETSLWLMRRRNLEIEGVYVAPVIDPVGGRLLLEKLNLKGVEAAASAYLWSASSKASA